MVDVTTPDGRRERVRVIGLDTPETVDTRRPVECPDGVAELDMVAQQLGQSITAALSRGVGGRTPTILTRRALATQRHSLGRRRKQLSGLLGEISGTSGVVATTQDVPGEA
jgi:hypothetical protein